MNKRKITEVRSQAALTELYKEIPPGTLREVVATHSKEHRAFLIMLYRDTKGKLYTSLKADMAEAGYRPEKRTIVTPKKKIITQP